MASEEKLPEKLCAYCPRTENRKTIKKWEKVKNEYAPLTIKLCALSVMENIKTSGERDSITRERSFFIFGSKFSRVTPNLGRSIVCLPLA